MDKFAKPIQTHFSGRPEGDQVDFTKQKHNKNEACRDDVYYSLGKAVARCVALHHSALFRRRQVSIRAQAPIILQTFRN
jgi:hypothetical protein